MVASLHSLLLAMDSKGMTTRLVEGNRLQSTGSLLMKAMQRHALRRRKKMARTERINGGATVEKTRRQMITWKNKRVLVDGNYRKPMSHIERKIRTLQRLLPDGDQSMELEGLLHEAADYIMCLQVQVKVMQIMVSVLSPKDSGV